VVTTHRDAMIVNYRVQPETQMLTTMAWLYFFASAVVIVEMPFSHVSCFSRAAAHH
jgi:hypothetical protein